MGCARRESTELQLILCVISWLCAMQVFPNSFIISNRIVGSISKIVPSVNRWLCLFPILGVTSDFVFAELRGAPGQVRRGGRILVWFRPREVLSWLTIGYRLWACPWPYYVKAAYFYVLLYSSDFRNVQMFYMFQNKIQSLKMAGNKPRLVLEALSSGASPSPRAPPPAPL